MWTPGYKNKPDVEPPGLLRFVAVLSIFSIIGVLVYAIAISITDIRSGPDAKSAAYVAVLHFLLPLGVTYTIFGNHPLSRSLIAIYVVVLSAATLTGTGFLGGLQVAYSIKAIGSFVIASSVLAWLFRGPKMRFYYALIGGKPIPDDLRARADELAGRAWLSPSKSAIVERIADNLETLVLLGFIAVTIYALFSMNP
jgi:hypothetical protein